MSNAFSFLLLSRQAFAFKDNVLACVTVSQQKQPMERAQATAAFKHTESRSAVVLPCFTRVVVVVYTE